MKVVNANRPMKRSPIGMQNGALGIQPQASTPKTNYNVDAMSSPFVKQEPHFMVSSNTPPPPLMRAPGAENEKAIDMKKSTLSAATPPLSNSNLDNSVNSSSSKTVYRSPNGKFAQTNGMTLLAAAAARARDGVAGRKSSGCRSCPNCLAEDCGECNYCRDKPKFGGPNTLKKKCVQKKCLVGSIGCDTGAVRSGITNEPLRLKISRS